MTSATSGAQPSTVTTPSASSVTSLSGRYGENTRSAQCSHKMASSSDPSSRAVAGTSKETTVPITGSATTAPVAMLYWLPWHGQSMVPLLTWLTMQPMWVQTALNALNSLAVGWV